jgi:hypothetical protein
MRAAGNRNKLDAEGDKNREEVEELGADINMLAAKLRQREGGMEPLRADASSYIINMLYAAYLCTIQRYYVPYDGTYGMSDQGQTLDV